MTGIWLKSKQRQAEMKIITGSRSTPHWLYPALKNLISEQSFERAVAILYPQRLKLGRGGPHESAIGATGPGTRWDKRTGHHHGTRRRCGPPDRPHGQDGLCRGAR